MFLIFAPCQVPAILHLLVCLLAQSLQEFAKINLGQRWSTQKQAMVKKFRNYSLGQLPMANGAGSYPN